MSEPVNAGVEQPVPSHSDVLREFYRRWNVPADQGNELRRLKGRVRAAIAGWLPHLAFYERYGNAAEDVERLVLLRLGEDVRDSSWTLALDGCRDSFEVAEFLQELLESARELQARRIDVLIDGLRKVVQLGRGTNFRLYAGGSGIGLVLPAGEPMLDEDVVNRVLIGLDQHQSSYRSFVLALTAFLGDEADRYRSVGDNLRVTLEQLLRDVLKSPKSLENQKEALGGWLKEKGVHPNIRNLYIAQMLDHYVQYQNDDVKHGPNGPTSKAEMEHLIYLTATFMRFILELEQTSTS